MMGVYSASLMGGGALGAQLSPLALQWGLGWSGALALWTLPVLAALALAWWQLGRMATPAAGATQRGASAWLLRRPRTWYLMLAFGLMNGGYASMIAWLAPHYQELGWSAAQSGTLVALLSIAQAAAALLLPVLAARGGPDRRPWLWFTLGCQALGFALLAMAPLAAPLATAIVLGVGLGGCFTFFMLVALDHLRAPLQAGALNALMQGGGFLLSALPTWLMARLHQGGGGGHHNGGVAPGHTVQGGQPGILPLAAVSGGAQLQFALRQAHRLHAQQNADIRRLTLNVLLIGTQEQQRTLRLCRQRGGEHGPMNRGQPRHGSAAGNGAAVQRRQQLLKLRQSR